VRDLRDKVVVLTGAGSGIGRALALQAAREGALLALCDWDEASVTETGRQASASRTLIRRVDVRDDGQVTAFAEAVRAELGDAHVLVNNAGVALSDTVGTMKRSDFEWLFQINFWGVVRGTEAFLPQLLRQSESHLVNISSLFGLVGVPAQSAYCASKFAVRGFTEALRMELHGGPVRVTCVHPGGVRTNIVRSGRMVRNSRGEPSDPALAAAHFERLAKHTPERAAETIWKGVRQNAPRVLVGPETFWLDLVQRLLPTGYATFVRFLRRLGERRGLRL
jgi:NAD(P)-dependent dehydrogenase (short-subunit alcohol dehydrogenase family)